jgi:MinD superfamily P-loop ATPase/DNA-binding NarL/FixJ family response regulator
MAIRVLVATRNWQDAGAISAALQSAGDIEVVGNPRSYQEVLDDAANLGANVVLLSPEISDYRPELVAALLRHDPPVATVALSPPTGDYATEMYRQGAVAHINLPVTSAVIGRLAEAIREAARAAEGTGRQTFTAQEADTLADLAGAGWQKSTTAIFSPKGGDGKTFVATNLAYLLGVVGRRKTLLIDADPKANVHVALHVPEDRNLFGLLLSVLERSPSSGNFPGQVGPDEVSARTLSAFVSHFGDPKKSNLDVLVGLPRLELAGHPSLRGRTNEERVRKIMLSLLRVAQQTYDFVVVDCGPDYNYPIVWASIEGADRTLLVTTPLETSVKCVRDGLELMRKAFPPEIVNQRFQLLINRFHDECGVDPGDVVSVLRLPKFGEIPDAGPVAALSVNRHMPLVSMRKSLKYPADEAADGLAAVAATIYPPLVVLWERAGGHVGKKMRREEKQHRAPVWMRLFVEG